MSNKPIKIVGYGACTACGATAGSSADKILQGQSGLAFQVDSPFPQARLNDDFGNDAVSLATRAIKEAIKSFPKDYLEKTALILSTAKGDILELEKLAATGTLNQISLPQDLTRALQTHFHLAPNPLTMSNACASGIIALAQGMRLISDGDFDHVLVVGVDLCTDFVVSGFGCLRALSDQLTQPYDESHKGLNLGAGSGAVLLSTDEKLPALGYFEGYGISNDANHITGPSRTGDGLAAAMQKALAMANISPEQIDLLNGHGTGTKYNDDMELLAVNTIFPEKAPPLFSYKGYIGHTIGAAGVIEAALSLELLKRQAYPASMGFSGNPNLPPAITVPTKPVWHDGHIDRLFAFKAGFGGINAAIIIKRGNFGAAND